MLRIAQFVADRRRDTLLTVSAVVVLLASLLMGWQKAVWG
jgi:hypothetical protein